MVKSFLMLALALAVPASTTPVTVEIVAIGRAVTPADHFELQVQLDATGDTQEAADAKLAALRTKLAAQVAAAGGRVVDTGKSNSFPDMSVMTDDMNVVDYDVADNMVVPPDFQAHAEVVLVADTPAAIAKAEAAAKELDGVNVYRTPQASLTDPTVADTAAKDDALAKARVQAARYSEKLGLPGITLVQISERVDVGTLIMMIGDKPGPPKLRTSAGDKVITELPLVFTFRLDPKR